MTQKKTERRYETASRNTERMFAESLKRLLKEMPLKKISVQKLADDCGVNRKTFYYHFEDVDDLLSRTLEMDALEAFQDVEACEDPEKLLQFCIEYLDKNRKMLKTIFQENISFEQTELYGGCHRIVRLMTERVEQERGQAASREYTDYVIEFYTNALAQSFYRYIHQAPDGQTKIMEYLLRLLRCSIPAALEGKQPES